MLQAVFPEIQWCLWKFRPLPKELWKMGFADVIPQFVEWLGEKLQIKKMEDWYRVSRDQLEVVVPLTIFGKLPLERMLQEVFPKHPWDFARLTVRRSTMKASQRKMAVLVGELFPNSGNL